MHNKASPYWDQFHVGHDAAVAEVSELFRAAYPEPSSAGEEPPAPDARSESQKEGAPIGPEVLEQALGARGDGQPWNGQVVQGASDFAHDLSVPVSDVAGIIRHCEVQLSAAPLNREETLATLAQEWSENAARNAVAAQLAARRLDPVLFGLLDDTGLGDDPTVIRWFAKVGQPLLEAAEQITMTHQNQAHPYNLREDPRHEAAVGEMQRLYAKLYGTRRVGGA